MAFEIVSLLNPMAVTNNYTGVVTISPAGNTAGATQAISSGSVVLAGGNNITLSQNGSTISIVGGAGGGGGGIANAAGTQTATSGTVVYSNSNNVSFGMSNNSVITASASFNQSAQTQNLHNVSLSGNTAGVMAQISSGTMTLAGGNNITLSQNGNAVTISGPNTVAQTDYVFSNSNGVSFGTNGSTVTATVATNYQSQGAYLTTARASNDAIGLGTAATNATFTANSAGFSFNGGAYLTTAQPVGAYLTTARASNDAIGLNTAVTNATATINSSGFSFNGAGYAGTNTTFNGTNVSGSITLNSNGLNLALSAPNAGGGAGDGYNILGINSVATSLSTTQYLSNGNNVSFGVNLGTITASASFNQTVQTQNLMTVNGTQGNVTVSGGNGVTVGNNASTITISVATNYQSQGAYLTTAAQSSVSNVSGVLAGTASNAATNQTAQLSGNISFANTNGVSFYTTASGATSGIAATVATNYQSQGAYLTTARASNDAVGLNTAITNGTWTVNSSGISLNLSNHLTTARASNDAIGLNTAGTNVTWTVNSSGISLNAGAYLTTAMASNRGSDFVNATAAFAGTNASGTIGSNGISVSVAPPGAAAENNWFNLAGNTSGNTTASGSTIQLIGGNNITLSGTNGSQIQIIGGAGGGGGAANFNLLGANTAGNTTASGSTIGLSGINLTLSGTNASAINISAPATSSLSATGLVSLSTNGSTISIGVAGLTFSNWEPYQDGNNSTYSSMGQNSLYLQKLKPEENYSFANFEVRMSGSFVSSSVSQVAAHSIRYGLYSMDTNSSYNSIATSLMFMQASFSSNASLAFTVSQGAASYTNSSLGTANASLYTGLKHLYLPFAGSMSAGGSYAFGIHISSATTVGTSPMRMALLNHTMINNLTIGKIYGSTVSATNASFVGDFAMGVLSATTGAMPSAVAESQMTNAISQQRLYIQLDT